MSTLFRDVDSSFTKICDFVFDNRLSNAISLLVKMTSGTSDAGKALQLEEIRQTYKTLLEYNFKDIVDPQRDAIFNKLKINLLELADEVQQLEIGRNKIRFSGLKLQLEKEKESARDEATRNINSYGFDVEFSRLLDSNDLLINSGEKPQANAVTPQVFQLLWLSDKYTENDCQLIRAIQGSESLPWYEKCMAVSAITLSLINCFDKSKFEVLNEFYQARENQVWQRAFTGLIIGFFIYNRRIGLYHSLNQLVEFYAEEQQFADDLNIFLQQILKAFETEKLTQTFRDEILPDVQKFESKIREKLDIESIITNELIEDKNPEWETLFEDNPDLLNKIEKMSEMQMEGLDLFMGTFAMLKNFDFFREISNWFRPFYKENSLVEDCLPDNQQGKWDFLEGLEQSFYMCNSDKYSFCFNLKHLPDDQTRNVVGLFNAEASQLREVIREDGLLNKPALNTYVFTQYIQDLYRFFKLHNYRNDFMDIFGFQWDIAGNEIIDKLNFKKGILRKAAEFLFAKEHYAAAAEIFLVLTKSTDAGQSVYEKLAYSYQRIFRYQEAIEYYKRAELFDTNRMWSIRKIIFCYRKSGDNESALKWAIEAEALEPEDAYLQTMLGNCYLDLHNYSDALTHYFKAEILDPENNKVLRPIAWCCLITGKPDLARVYFNRISEANLTANDLINAGHTELSSGNKAKAMVFYKQAISDYNLSLEKFSETIAFDMPHLRALGISQIDLQFVIDFLSLKP